MVLSIDIETFSSVDLSKSGVYKYAESPDFEILLFGYSLDGGPVQVVDFTQGEELPIEVMEALLDDKTPKWAFNSSFERTCIARFLQDKGRLAVGEFLSPESWYCSMVWSAYILKSRPKLNLQFQNLVFTRGHSISGTILRLCRVSFITLPKNAVNP